MTAVPLYPIISRNQCHTHSYNWLKCFPSKDCLQLSLVQPWLRHPRQGYRVGSYQRQSASAALTHLMTGCSFDWSLSLLTVQVGDHAHLRQSQNENSPSSTCVCEKVPITEEKLSLPEMTDSLITQLNYFQNVLFENSICVFNECDHIYFTVWLLEKTNGSLTSISIVHLCMRVGPYTGAWTA